jgi:hypothetical protein
MKFALMITLATAWPSLAIIPEPTYFQCSTIDRVADAAKSGSPSQALALDVLERIGEGRLGNVSATVEVQLGLAPGQLRSYDFNVSTARVHAIRSIGKLDLPEALLYLQNLTRNNIDPDFSGAVWPAVQIALHEAQMGRIPGEQDKVRFLEDATRERSAAASWAVTELCNRGSLQSLPFIREQIRKTYSLPQDVSQETESCEAHMGIVSRNPDRLKALGSYLSVTAKSTGLNLNLIGWAIAELEMMKSQQANAELQRYAKEIDELPDSSPLKDELNFVRMRLRSMPLHSSK